MLRASQVLFGLGLLIFPFVTNALCDWSLNANCTDIGWGWSLADRESNCANSGAKPNGTTAKCCCGPNPGCCAIDTIRNVGSGSDTTPETVTKSSNEISSHECDLKAGLSSHIFYEGYVSNSDGDNCVKESGKCYWVTNAKCADVGYVDGNDSNCLFNTKPNASTSKCCCPTRSSDQGCCQLTTTKQGEKSVKSALNITSAECVARNKRASGTGGTTIDAVFWGGQVPDATNENCVKPPAKGDASSGAPGAPGSPGQVGGEVRFNYSGMTNPLETVSVSVVVGRVIKAILAIIGSIFLIMVIYGGFTWMTAAGNDTKVAKGRNILIWAIIGIIVIFLAWMLVAVIFEALGV